MVKNIQAVQEFLKIQKKERFLAACLITIVALCSVIVWMEFRYEGNISKLQNCKEEKVQLKQDMVDHLTKDNERDEAIKDREVRKKDRLDSIEEILQLKKLN